MSAQQQLSLGFVERTSSCILDAELALAPGGLLFAVRLARAVPVWLTRGFWRLVDGADFYRQYPIELCAQAQRSGRIAEILESLAIWHAAWLNGALDGAFHWIGDARRESALPGQCTVEDINRYEHLAGALAMRATGPPPEVQVDGLTSCGIEAVALAATLAAESPIVLTLAAAVNGRPPGILKSLPPSAHIKVEAIAKGAGFDQLPAGIAPVVRNARIAGLKTAALHVFSPRALAVSISPISGDGAEPETGEASVRLDPWTGTRLLWHDIG
jgi:hypothetical protein